MKKSLCLILALVSTVLFLSSSMFAYADEADGTDVIDEAQATQAAEPTEPPVEEAEEEMPLQLFEIIVANDGSSTSSLLSPVPKEYESQLDGLLQQYQAMGIDAEVVDIEGTGYKGLKTKAATTKDEVFDLATPGDNKEFYQAWKIKTWFTDLYILDVSYDLSQSSVKEDVATIKLTLPAKARFTNAEQIDGKTYQWALRSGTNNHIRLTMERINLVGWIAIGLLALIIIVLILLFVSKKKKTEETVAGETEEGAVLDGETSEEAIEEDTAVETEEDTDTEQPEAEEEKPEE